MASKNILHFKSDYIQCIPIGKKDVIYLSISIFQIALFVLSLASLSHAHSYCSGYDKAQKNSIYGDALSDSPTCLARDGKAYPSQELKQMLPTLQKLYRGNNRQGRGMFGSPRNHVQDPHLTTQELLDYHTLASQGRIEEITAHIRHKRQGK